MPFGFAFKKQADLPPGSLGWPILGEALSYARSPHGFFESRARKYGGVFKTRILGSKIVCFVGPEAFSFFVDNPGFHRDGGAPAHVQKLLCQQSLPLIDGTRHAAMRQKVQSAFVPDAVVSYLSVFGQLLDQYAERWSRAGEFAWVAEYKQLSASFCASLLLGAEPKPGNNDGLSRLIDQFMAGLASFPLNLPWTTYGKALKRRDRLLDLIDAAIAEHRRSKHDDMLSRLLDARDQDGEPLSDEELRAQMVHLFFAAYGGVLRVLSLMSMDLALNPDVRRKGEEELNRVSPPGPPTIETLLSLRYLESVTREVRRHNRIFASNFFDRAPEGAHYGGYSVPPGWKVTGAIYQTMQDGGVYSEPDLFEPDRFGAERHEGSNAPNSYVPHGGGGSTGHRCPAEDLTTLIMLQAGAALLRSYDWELAPGQDLSLNNEPSPLPRDGIRVLFRRKQPAA